MSSFEERAHNMSLVERTSGCFNYTDRFSSVEYKILYTADNQRIPRISVHTGRNQNELFYRGTLSDGYKFKGNEELISQIQESVSQTSIPIFKESYLLNNDYCKLSYGIVIENRENFDEVGNIRPLLNIYNSYDGSMASLIVFGLHILDEKGREFNCGFSKTFGTIREVHLENSPTTISPMIGEFVQTFSENIGEMVGQNFNTLDDQTVFDTLELIENIGGKNRRKSISGVIEEINERRNRLTNWDIFKAITLYTTNEKNLNVKRLENILERLFNIPSEMLELAKKCNQNK